MSMFSKAVRKRAFLKLAFEGGPGTGKTLGALLTAKGLASGGPVAVIDTENGSASLYSDRFDFDTINLSPPFSDDKFVEAINASVAEGYSVLIIDSFSHAWEWTLDYKIGLDNKGGNSFVNWGNAGKRFKRVLDAILQSKIHVIVAMRSKTEYILENDIKGRQVPKKVGLAPIMRDSIEFEFSTVFTADSEHFVTVEKDRTCLFTDTRFVVTEATGTALLNWLHDQPEPEPEPTLQEKLATELADVDPETLRSYLIARGASPDGSIATVTDSYAQKALGALPRLREGITKFSQDLGSNGSVPANATES